MEFIHPVTKKTVILESIIPRKWNYDGKIVELVESKFVLEDFELCHALLSTMVGENLTPYEYIDWAICKTKLSPTVYNSILETKLPDGFILCWYDIMHDGYPEEYPKTYGEILKTLGRNILLCDDAVEIPVLKYNQSIDRNTIRQMFKSEIRDNYEKIASMNCIGKYDDFLNYRFSDIDNTLMFGRFRQGSAEKDFAEVRDSKEFLKKWREERNNLETES